jgi:hypothetical protein
VTGGYFADGLRKHVPNLARLGFPFADVSADGSAIISKLPEAGGRVDRATCLEQLLYEVEDPANYITPDVVVDFRQVQLAEVGPDAVRVSGAVGRPAPEMLKASLGLEGGFTGSGAISYAGPGCLARSRLAAEIVQERWTYLYGRDPSELYLEFIGLSSCAPWLGSQPPASTEPPEVRLRITTQNFDRQVALNLAHEVESLYTNGPAGGGGVETSVRDTIALISTLVPRELVEPRIVVLE